ncbi:hypothetical protein OEZ85_005733 [Tetradesmus obliquus]|uniref:Uncharacterized protein n=1 Tax=Tetradesmus obliquus TaxID=3088 RepID=A0ABY8UEP5_TETOB|nr:hypothetical protein OEZ85_005733 [Tetradesmus obliquus]
MNLVPCELVKYLRGRTLWIIGDSHARTFYRAMQCFLMDFWSHQECKPSMDDAANAALANMPVVPGGANCFHLTEVAGGRVCVVHSVKGTNLLNNPKVAEGGVLPLLHKKFARPQDIFYINFGIWHKSMEEWEHSYWPALEQLGQFYKATKSRLPVQHQHWGPGIDPANRAAAKEYSTTRCYLYNTSTGDLDIDPANRAAAKEYDQAWLLGIPLDKVAHNILRKYELPINPGFNISVALHGSHAVVPVANGMHDCKHYCHPGVPQIWIWYLYDFLRSPQGVPVLPNVATAGPKLGCKIHKTQSYGY